MTPSNASYGRFDAVSEHTTELQDLWPSPESYNPYSYEPILLLFQEGLINSLHYIFS